MPQMSGGDAVVQALIAHGITSIYCLPGIQNDHLFNALFDAGDAIGVVHTRHEQGAAYMALGAALATGKPQVYLGRAGAGPAQRHGGARDRLVDQRAGAGAVGQIPSRFIGKGHGMLHEIPDQIGILQHADQMGRARSRSRRMRPALVGAGVPVHDLGPAAAGRARDRAGHPAGARRHRSGGAAAAARAAARRGRDRARREAAGKGRAPADLRRRRRARRCRRGAGRWPNGSARRSRPIGAARA